MGVGLEQWRASVGTFRQTFGSLTEYRNVELLFGSKTNRKESSTDSCCVGVITIWALLTTCLLLLANDVELNPGPRNEGRRTVPMLRVRAELTIRPASDRTRRSNLERLTSRVYRHLSILVKYRRLQALSKLRADFISQIKASTSLVSRSLKERYKATTVTVDVKDGNTLELFFTSASERDAEKLVQACKNGELEKLIQREVLIPTLVVPWDLKLIVEEDDALQFLKQQHCVDTTCRLLASVLKDEKSTEFDLHSVLKKSEVQLKQDENGYNELHRCVLNNRVKLLKVFMAHGHWDALMRQEVPRGSQSEFATCTSRQMAEQKRLFRIVKEMDRLSALEKSLTADTTLLQSCRSGDLETVQALHYSGYVNMEAKDSEGNTGIHWAAVSGNLEVVKYLVGLGIRADVQNKDKETALHVAVTYGQSQLIEFLVKDCNLDPEMAGKTGKTPLQTTAENGDIRSMQELLKCRVRFDPSLGVVAAEHGRKAYLEHILKSYGVDPFYKNREDETCLMTAAENGHLKIVEFLLNEYEYKLDDVSKQNRNVLHCAAYNGHADVARVLLEKARAEGALPNVLNQKDIHCSVMQPCPPSLGFDEMGEESYVPFKRKHIHLIQKCTEVGQVDDSRFGVLKKYIQTTKQATPTHDGEPDLTPLMLAIVQGHAQVAKLYIEAGADVTTRDCFQLTAMHLCAMRGTAEVAALLKDKGLELEEGDEDGDTPADVAEANEHWDMLTFFKYQTLEDFRMKTFELLSPEKLNRIRCSGGLVEPYIRRTVRELHTHMNHLFRAVDAGPGFENAADRSCTQHELLWGLTRTHH